MADTLDARVARRAAVQLARLEREGRERRLAALAPELLQFMRDDLLPWLAYQYSEDGQRLRRTVRALVAKADGLEGNDGSPPHD